MTDFPSRQCSGTLLAKENPVERTFIYALIVALGGWLVPLFSSMVLARLILVSFGRLARRNAYLVKYAAFGATFALFTGGVVLLRRIAGVAGLWLWIAYGWSFSNSLNALIDADRQRITGRRPTKAAAFLRRGRRWRIMWRYRAVDRYRRSSSTVARWMRTRRSLRDGA